ncbi:MAG: tetratricopeptide (TPR) repeat protein/tRNA A-37 threonylcarbamoyl transferase component Bud32, partial [Kiritimatiellia bacterium]
MSGPFSQGPSIGTTLGSYRLIEPLGAGGIAAVFRAEDEEGRSAAIKILHPKSLGTDEVRRFQREYRALARIQHANIVQVYDTGVFHDYPWIAMQFIDGVDLDQQVRQWEVHPSRDRWERVEQVLRGLCLALDQIHALGLIHRDLKPSNVLIDKNGEPHLSDFGVVKDSHSKTTQLTMHGNLVGTVAFMAPEQITEEPVDARTDLYSLGAVLYVMLTGKRPIDADSVTGFLARHLSHVPAPPTSIRPSVPRRLERVCQRLLYKDRAQRYESAKAVLRALDDVSDPDIPPLRGRDELLAEWRARLEQLRSGAGGVTAVLGPTNSGKNFTLGALADIARNTGFMVARTHGQARNPITALLRDLNGPADSTPTNTHLRALATHVRQGPTVLMIDEMFAARPSIIDALGRLVRKLVGQEGEPLLLCYSVTDVAEAISELHYGHSTGLPAEEYHLTPIHRTAVYSMLRDRGLRGSVASVLGRRLASELAGRPGAIDSQIQALCREGWLKRVEGRLQSNRAPDIFARKDLPVPTRIQTDIQRRLGTLDIEALGASEAMAVLGRAAPAELILECAESSGSTLERVLESGIATQTDDTVRFVHPWARSVVLEQVPPERRRHLHSTIARILTRRHRRRMPAEIATHHARADEPQLAYPLFVAAARKAARDKLPHVVVRNANKALEHRDAGEKALDMKRAVELRKRLYNLLGQAHLDRTEWAAAALAFEQAAAAARVAGDALGLAKALAGLGRARYREGKYDQATPLLREALSCAPPGTAERAPALRTLADILIRNGSIEEAETLWTETLTTAQRDHNHDSEARARRGLAHIRAFQGQLEQAALLLDQAESLLNPSGDPRVRAAVLSRSIELDLAAARFDAALRRLNQLQNLINDHELLDRMAQMHGLACEVYWNIGRSHDAESSIRQTLHLARDASTWSARLRACRILCALGLESDAAAALPDNQALPLSPSEDPSAQLAAVRARALAPRHPSRALDLATWCKTRAPIGLILHQAHACVDLSKAFCRVGDLTAARQAAKDGLMALEGPGCEGLRLELLAAFHSADPDPRIADALEQVAQRVLAHLPPDIATSLKTRPDLVAVLG